MQDDVAVEVVELRIRVDHLELSRHLAHLSTHEARRRVDARYPSNTAAPGPGPGPGAGAALAAGGDEGLSGANAELDSQVSAALGSHMRHAGQHPALHTFSDPAALVAYVNELQAAADNALAEILRGDATAPVEVHSLALRNEHQIQFLSYLFRSLLTVSHENLFLT